MTRNGSAAETFAQSHRRNDFGPLVRLGAALAAWASNLPLAVLARGRRRPRAEAFRHLSVALAARRAREAF